MAKPSSIRVISEGNKYWQQEWVYVYFKDEQGVSVTVVRYKEGSPARNVWPIDWEVEGKDYKLGFLVPLNDQAIEAFAERFKVKRIELHFNIFPRPYKRILPFKEDSCNDSLKGFIDLSGIGEL